MASPEVIEFERLLAPISEDHPVGEDLREDRSPTSEYYALKDARNQARAAERHKLFDEESSSSTLAEWRPVMEKAATLLEEKTKDLEVAAWYTEALVRYHGFAGLRDGFKLILQLVESYWDDLYPLPDEDGMETKVAPLTGLNGEGGDGTLIAPIRNIMITEDTSAGHFAFWQYQQALDIAKIPDEDQQEQRIAATGISLEVIQRAIDESSESYCRDTLEDIEQCLETYQALIQAVDADERAGKDGPPSSNIRNTLQEVLGGFRHLTKDKIIDIVEEETEETDELAEGGSAVNASGGATVASGPIKSREQAFKQLLEIADFFLKTEPHSPVSYLLKKTVRWGRMPLTELMRELLPDDSAQETYSSLTGVKMLEEEEDY